MEDTEISEVAGRIAPHHSYLGEVSEWGVGRVPRGGCTVCVIVALILS